MQCTGINPEVPWDLTVYDRVDIKEDTADQPEAHNFGL